MELETISGMILSQNEPPAEHIPFGRYKSAKNGCGWIAAYNVLQILGISASVATVIRNIAKRFWGIWFGGKIGANPVALVRSLKNDYSPGMKVRIMFSRKEMIREASRHKACILMYIRKDFTGHYIAFHSEEADQLHFYNLEFTGTFAEYFQRRESQKPWFKMLICIDDV